MCVCVCVMYLFLYLCMYIQILLYSVTVYERMLYLILYTEYKSGCDLRMFVYRFRASLKLRVCCASRRACVQAALFA